MLLHRLNAFYASFEKKTTQNEAVVFVLNMFDVKFSSFSSRSNRPITKRVDKIITTAEHDRHKIVKEINIHH